MTVLVSGGGDRRRQRQRRRKRRRRKRRRSRRRRRKRRRKRMLSVGFYRTENGMFAKALKAYSINPHHSLLC
jgi:hypothetical protein